METSLGWPDQALVAQRRQGRLQIGPGITLRCQRGERGGLELNADHRRPLDNPALDWQQTIKPGGEERRDALRHRYGVPASGELPPAILLADHPGVGQHRDHMLDEQRVAVRDRQDPVGQVRRQPHLAQEVGQDPRGVVPGQLVQLDQVGAATVGEEAGMLLYQLMAGGTEYQQRNALRHPGDLPDEVEEDRLSPMDVIEDHDERPTPRDDLQENARAPEQLVLAVAARAHAHQRGDSAGDVLVFGADQRPQLGPGLVLRILGRYPGRPTDSLGDRPEGDALAIGQASAPQYLRTVAKVADELLDQPGLAEPGLTYHGHDLGPRFGDGPLERDEQPLVGLVPADDGQVNSPRDRLAPAHGEQPVSRNPIGLAL